MTSEMTATDSALDQTRAEKFCFNLADVMHAIAQPLTVLQVRLDHSAAEEMDTAELRLLVTDSARQVQRLSTLLGFMQGFIVAESTEPHFSEQDVGLMLEHVAEGMSLFYREAGMNLRVKVPDIEASVFVDQKRVYQALSRVLLVVFELSIAKDTIELKGSTSYQGVKIVIRNMDAYRALGKESALKLALAQANIERQGGSLMWKAEPFSVEIELRSVRSSHTQELGDRS